MKKLVLILLVFVVTFAGITGSLYGQKIGVCIGAKGGMYLFGSGFSIYEMSNIYPIGALIGYTLPLPSEILEVGIEGEFNYGIAGGDFDIMDLGTITGEYDLWTIGGYGVLRTFMGKMVYLKGKIGMIYISETLNGEVMGTPMPELTTTQTGLSLGAGLGVKPTDMIGIETEFVIIARNCNYISLGVNLMF